MGSRLGGLDRGARARVLALAGALALGLASCSGTSGAPVGDSETHQLLEQMPDAPFASAYRGRRRVELHYEDQGIPAVVEYVEDVEADGSGRFGIEVVDVRSAAVDPELFGILQHARQVFNYRYRDFRVRDLRAFLRNYRVQVVDEHATVAGVDCVELLVARESGGIGPYRVSVDPQTGLVLRWEQRTDDGRLLGLVEFENIVFGPPQVERQLVERNLETRTLEELDFEVCEPTRPPSGYQLESTGAVVDPLGRTWARLVYGDGVEQVFFLHRAPEGPDPEHAPGRVERIVIGPWTVVVGEVKGRSLIAVGKVHEDELFLMIQSAF